MPLVLRFLHQFTPPAWHLLVPVVLLWTTFAVSASDIKAGKNRSAPCTACHGYNGITANDEWPNLAGQKTGYLVQQIKAFRDGARTDPLMSEMTAGMTDADIENIAAYFNSLSAP